MLRDDDIEYSQHLSIPTDSRDDKEIVSDNDIENEFHISQKAALNTLNTNNITCNECGEIFPDEDELYD